MSELSITSDDWILLRGNSIVVPDSLRQQALELAHESYQVESTHVWKSMVSRYGCTNLSHGTQLCCVSSVHWSMIDRTFEHVSTTHSSMGPCVNGFMWSIPIWWICILVVICEYPRYPVVEIIKSTSANTVLPVLEKIFSMFSIPTQVKLIGGALSNHVSSKSLPNTWASHITRSARTGQEAMLKQNASWKHLRER